jgi:hypothetical protein
MSLHHGIHDHIGTYLDLYYRKSWTLTLFMQFGDLCLFPQFQTFRCSRSILIRIFSPSRSKKKGAWLLQQLQNSERTVFLAVLEAQQREAEEGNRYLLGRTEGAWTESPKLELPVGIEPFVLLPQAGALLARLELSGNIFKRNALDTSRADTALPSTQSLRKMPPQTSVADST